MQVVAKGAWNTLQCHNLRPIFVNIGELDVIDDVGGFVSDLAIFILHDNDHSLLDAWDALVVLDSK